MASSLRPQVVVLDLHLPDMTGVEARRLAATTPETRVLVLSASGERRTHRRGKAAPPGTW